MGDTSGWSIPTPLIDRSAAGCSSLIVAALHNGDTSDSAARKEGEQTSAGLMKCLVAEGKEELTKVYGIPRKFIVHMDSFHCCNLAVQHATEKAFGTTKNSNKRPVHHRQLLQTIHDIVICDKDFAFADLLRLEEASTRGSPHVHTVLFDRAAFPEAMHRVQQASSTHHSWSTPRIQ